MPFYPDFPYTNLYTLNLDWLIKIVKDIEEKQAKIDPSFVYSPDNPPPYPVTSVNHKTGAIILTIGDIAQLQELLDSKFSVDNKPDISGVTGLSEALTTKYSAENVPPYPVVSFNNRTGAIDFTREDAEAVQPEIIGDYEGNIQAITHEELQEFYESGYRILAADYSEAAGLYTNLYMIQRFTDEYQLFRIAQYTGSEAGQVNSVNDKTGVVYLYIDDIPNLSSRLAEKFSASNPPNITDVTNLSQTLAAKYSESNPPPYPVRSVNGKTGTVVIKPVMVTCAITNTGTQTSQRFSVSGITSGMRVIHSYLDAPDAQGGEWTVSTALNSVTISGDIIAPCNLTLILNEVV